jgi:hypothetical protein
MFATWNLLEVKCDICEKHNKFNFTEDRKREGKGNKDFINFG